MDDTSPRVSVIIPTYNWSAALRLAIGSVLRQSFEDYELLVVGDGCNDDSEAVTLSFGDPRIRWFNLPEHHKSQHAPNNFAIGQARGQYVAYLGHDDVWWPTHLAAMVQAADAGAGVIASGVISSGPAESGMKSIAGLFPASGYGPMYFFPPCALMHLRDLAVAVGGWRAPGEAQIAIDVDFLSRLHQSGAPFASTGEVTVFKFNAAWRRDAYRTRSVTQQAEVLAGIDGEGEAFRQKALMALVRSVVEDRFIRGEPPLVEVRSAAANMATWQVFKGSRERDAPAVATPLPSGLRFFNDEPYTAFEWHPVESDGAQRWRWTGPSTHASFILPIRIDRPFELRITVLHVLRPDDFPTASLWHGETRLESRQIRQADGTWIWSAVLDPTASPEPIETITIVYPKLARPIDMGRGLDRRWLGISVGPIDLLILEEARPAASVAPERV